MVKKLSHPRIQFATLAQRWLKSDDGTSFFNLPHLPGLTQMKTKEILAPLLPCICSAPLSPKMANSHFFPSQSDIHSWLCSNELHSKEMEWEYSVSIKSDYFHFQVYFQVVSPYICHHSKLNKTYLIFKKLEIHVYSHQVTLWERLRFHFYFCCCGWQT